MTQRPTLARALLALALAGASAPALLADEVTVSLAAGDGFVRMADGRPLYWFSFSDVSGVPQAQQLSEGLLGASSPAPTIVVDEGDELSLRLLNVGLVMRPDLQDPHTVHWHGFPNAAPVFDGVPDSSIAIGMGGVLTYFYRAPGPGTYLYHCHVEATEHMQMGMIGNLWVRAAQDALPPGTDLDGYVHQAGDRYAYNDGDGSTRYDVEYPIQLISVDSTFHDASLAVQPLPFALMRDDYALMNGRGYPDTKEPGPLDPPDENGGKVSQPLSSLIEADQGQRILLRVTNVSVTRLFTLNTVGLTFRVVGRDAKLLRSPTGRDLSYETSSVTLGGGESRDLIIDTTGVTPGRYFLHTTNLHHLSNGTEDFGGLMTEIVVH